MAQTDLPHARLLAAGPTTVAIPRPLSSERLALVVTAITLAVFTVAEVVTVYTNPFTGIALHAITLSTLLVGAGFGGQSGAATEQPVSRLLHALALVPLIRIVSLIFAILHIGYRSGTDLLFVFLIALLYGWVVRRTGSIIGVSVSHGVTNITLFLLVPFIPVLSAQPDWLPPLY